MHGQRIIYLLVFLLLFVFAGAAHAATWHQYASNDFYTLSYDSDDIRHPEALLKVQGVKILPHPNYRRVWTKQVAKGEEGRKFYLKEQTKRGYSIVGYDTYRYTIVQKDLDCADKRFRVVAEADYNDKGILLDSMVHEAKYLRWMTVMADSEDDRLIREVCNRRDDVDRTLDPNHPLSPSGTTKPAPTQPAPLQTQPAKEVQPAQPAQKSATPPAL